jgi:hypothetical protein
MGVKSDSCDIRSRVIYSKKKKTSYITDKVSNVCNDHKNEGLY